MTKYFIALMLFFASIQNVFAYGKLTVGPVWNTSNNSASMGLGFEATRDLLGPYVKFKTVSGLGTHQIATGDITNFYQSTNGILFSVERFEIETAFALKYVTPFKAFENEYFLKASALLW